MRKAISILLILSLVLPVTGIFLHYQVNQKQIRKEVKHRMLTGIDRDQLERLAFHHQETAQLTWKHSREFVFQGQFYDIVETHSTTDSIIYYCWWDNDETVLHQQLDALLASLMQRDPEQQQKQTRISDFFKSLYCEQAIALAAKPVASQSISFPDNIYSIYLRDDSPPVPPPESSSHIISMM